MKIQEILKLKEDMDPNHLAHINLMYTAGYFYNKMAAMLKPFEMTPEQFNVLRIVKGSLPKVLCISEITERMIDKSSNVSRIIDRLENKAWVSRVRSEFDKRAASIQLTEKGLEQINKTNAAIQNELKHALSLDNNQAILLNNLLDESRL
jgi:DNA-binding MarR family transcriptional regulator